MRVIIQRASHADVVVDGEQLGAIEHGLMVLVGFGNGDGRREMEWMARKIVGLRIFEDAEERMNLSVGDIGGGILLVPNFTLYAECQKGRRPSFSGAAAPDIASGLFDEFCRLLEDMPVPVAKGKFGADMRVTLCNDGPVTVIIDSPE